MTNKKFRQKQFKRYLSLGYPRYVASRLARGKSLSELGFEYVDDLTPGRFTYFNEESRQVVRIDVETEIWDSFTLKDGDSIWNYID